MYHSQVIYINHLGLEMDDTSFYMNNLGLEMDDTSFYMNHLGYKHLSPILTMK